MYTLQPKKLLIINILDILKKYTDEDHRLNQKEIRDILKKEYGMEVDRKAIKRNLLNLIEFGYEIEYKEDIRMVENRKTGKLEESVLMSDFYLVREFSDSELRLLIDSLLFCKHIPDNHRRDMIEKLGRLSNKYFHSRVNHIKTIADNSPQNKQLFLTIDIIDEAIRKGKQISFTYNEYGTDKRLHPRKNSEGIVREYIINPYQIAAVNGKYYLICNYDKYDNVANYRLDLITNIKILDTPIKSKKLVKGLENGFNLPKHMAEHIYMFTGESGVVTFRLKKYLISDIIDWFGKDVVFFDETEDEVRAKVTVNLIAMRKWALQYALHTKILSPKSLVDEVKEDIRQAMENYED